MAQLLLKHNFQEKPMSRNADPLSEYVRLVSSLGEKFNRIKTNSDAICASMARTAEKLREGSRYGRRENPNGGGQADI